ncbi:hypothetical protein M422DRAFT_242371 [Sphaerobolus stellatus SS14]|nr:hypothetical protein M422DRAFT_242371 [Sphaerobolus stellatus SS14]
MTGSLQSCLSAHALQLAKTGQSSQQHSDVDLESYHQAHEPMLPYEEEPPSSVPDMEMNAPVVAGANGTLPDESTMNIDHELNDLYDSNVFYGGALTASGANSMTSEGVNVETEDENENEDGAKTPAPRKKQPYKSSSPGVALSAKKKGHTSGVDAIMHLAGTVVKGGARLTSPEPGKQGGLKPSPVRCTTAYQVAEEEEELSDNSLVCVMKVFQGSTEHADAYLAFKCKGACHLWL